MVELIGVTAAAMIVSVILGLGIGMAIWGVRRAVLKREENLPWFILWSAVALFAIQVLAELGRSL